MSQIVLADRYNTHDVIKEEKQEWVKTILVLLGVPEQELFEGNQDILMQYGIQVWDHLDNGDTEILQNNVLVAKWYAPTLLPKYDENQNIYYEIHLDYDSIVEDDFHSSEMNNE